MSPIETMIVGALLPPFVAFIKQEHFPQIYNAIIAVVVYLVVGIVAVPLSGQTIDITNLLTAFATISAAGTIAYQAFWKNLEA